VSSNSITKFPALYKKTSTGAIQQWDISVEPRIGQMTREGFAPEIGLIVTKFGQVGGKIQITNDTITEGKNKGKKNETSALEQAIKEAEARWTKQKKKGYVESIEAAQLEEVDKVIEGGISPMLAHVFSKHGHKIKYPCYFQYKLDGTRLLCVVKDGKASLWSRTRKKITSLPHIIEEVERNSHGRSFILDGEAYNHNYKDNFEKIVSLVRQEEPDPNHTEVEYHVYDMPSFDGDFIERLVNLEDYFEFAIESRYVKKVDTSVINSEDEVMDAFYQAKELGYEGIMIRNFKGRYLNKRSYDLLKVKEFDDSEFKIIGIEEGRGKLAGHVGAFVCETEDGKQFLAKAKGSLENLKKYFENHSLWEGKFLTVQYQGLTKYGIPRFPVGLRIREEL
jgi:DNA ligase-1